MNFGTMGGVPVGVRMSVLFLRLLFVYVGLHCTVGWLICTLFLYWVFIYAVLVSVNGVHSCLSPLYSIIALGLILFSTTFIPASLSTFPLHLTCQDVSENLLAS